jgi:hypothetical protein
MISGPNAARNAANERSRLPRYVGGSACDLAAQIAPGSALRTLGALHVATYSMIRRKLGADIDGLTADRCLEVAMRSV